ncbi:MAG: nuclear transport factor 2 family protein [Terriglobales bacterium]
MKIVKKLRLFVIGIVLIYAQIIATPVGAQTKAAGASAQKEAKEPAEAMPPIGGMQQVAILEQRYRLAALDGDAAYVKKLLATGYIGTGPDGVVSDRMETITAYEKGALKFSSIELDQMKGISQGPNVVVINARATVKGKFNDRDISGAYRYTRVWVKRGGNWQVIAFQISRTVDSGAGQPGSMEPKKQ